MKCQMLKLNMSMLTKGDMDMIFDRYTKENINIVYIYIVNIYIYKYTYI